MESANNSQFLNPNTVNVCSRVATSKGIYELLGKGTYSELDQLSY